MSEIWEYRFDEWSESQADKYYDELIANCQKIAEDTTLGKNYRGILNQLFGFKINGHIIFYRVLNENYIEITRILYERMDLKTRIAE